MKDKKYRSYELILYPENELHMDIICEVKKKYDHAYILHNKDLKEDLSEYKKEHYHLLIFLKNQRTISSLAKELNIDNPNLINIVKDKKKAIRYLIHADNNEKEQYDVDNIQTNMDIAPYFKNLVSDETCDIQIILDFLDTNDNNLISFRNFVSFIREANIWSTYRRNQFIINKLIEEHNNVLKGEILEIFK